MKLLPLLLVLVVTIFGSPLVTSAHELASTGSMGVVFHSDPDDDLVAGQTSTLFFDLKDTAGKFSQSQCDCQVEIQESGRSIFQTKATPISDSAYSTSFVFPKNDTYTVVFKGSAQDTSFPSFSVSYDTKVAKADVATSSASTFGSTQMHIVETVGGVVLAILVFLFILSQLKAKPDK
jgi:hypothetical protein